jgi:hypothetical protein
MPYIPRERRNFLLGKFMDDLQSVDLSAGDLNFIISNLLWRQFRKERSYAKANELAGVLECAKLEMYRRLIVPYENQKQVQNGDII